MSVGLVSVNVDSRREVPCFYCGLVVAIYDKTRQDQNVKFLKVAVGVKPFRGYVQSKDIHHCVRSISRFGKGSTRIRVRGNVYHDHSRKY